MGYASKLGRARISPRSPQAAAQCDRCGFVYNHADLRWQFDWAGSALANKRLLVCARCEDIPQEQFRAITIPADPTPILNPRPVRFPQTYDASVADAASAVSNEVGGFAYDVEIADAGDATSVEVGGFPYSDAITETASAASTEAGNISCDVTVTEASALTTTQAASLLGGDDGGLPAGGPIAGGPLAGG